MIDVIQTLKNLNKEFPRFQLETLIKIVECIREKSEYTITSPQPWYANTITCNDNQNICRFTSVGDNPEQFNTSTGGTQGFVYNTTTKNHTPDKTSSHQTIISSGDIATDEDMNFSSIIRDASDLHELIKAAYEANRSIEK